MPRRTLAPVQIHPRGGQAQVRQLGRLQAKALTILQGQAQTAAQLSQEAVLGLIEHVAGVNERCDRLQAELQQHSCTTPTQRRMQSELALMRADLTDALGLLQFQDVNRQLLGQLAQGLGHLASQAGPALSACAAGDCTPAIARTTDLMVQWRQSYVMAHQHFVHDASMAKAVENRPDDTDDTDDIRHGHEQDADGTVIELF